MSMSKTLVIFSIDGRFVVSRVGEPIVFALLRSDECQRETRGERAGRHDEIECLRGVGQRNGLRCGQRDGCRSFRFIDRQFARLRIDRSGAGDQLVVGVAHQRDAPQVDFARDADFHQSRDVFHRRYGFGSFGVAHGGILFMVERVFDQRLGRRDDVSCMDFTFGDHRIHDVGIQDVVGVGRNGHAFEFGSVSFVEQLLDGEFAAE